MNSNEEKVLARIEVAIEKLEEAMKAYTEALERMVTK